MILLNSIRSILRSFGKTALFTLLIFALTLTLALAVSVWASVAEFLKACDEFYTTIALVEYMGTEYPNDTIYDAGMAGAVETFDSAAVAGDSAVLSWEEPGRSMGYIDGFWRTDTFAPDRMLSVLVVGRISYNEQKNAYNAIVLETLYSALSRDNTSVLIAPEFGEFEPGHIYLVFGEIYRARSPLLHLRPAEFGNEQAVKYGGQIPRRIDITADRENGPAYLIPEDSVLVKIAETLAVTNNSVLVNATGDLLAQYPFHQQELFITEGRPFSPEEYASGSRVAVVSELLAARLGIGVGDPFDLSVALSDQPGIYNAYWVDTGFSYRETFTVVGITNTVMDKSWYVYVPKAAGVPVSKHPVGYTVGQAVIRNQDAAAFAARAAPLARDRFQLNIYDQGYSAVAVPYQTILSVAKIVTAVCVLVELAALTLFGFLFVYRQRETSETMRMLGATRVQVIGYFLFSAGLIALISSAAGAAAGYWLHDRIIALVIRAADRYAVIDARYSSGNLTISRTLDFAPQLEARLFAIVGTAVFVAAVLACLAFAAGTFLRSRSSRGELAGPRSRHKTSRLDGGSLKFALLSVLRGGGRSLVVPVLAAAVALFFGQLAATSQRYQQQLDAIYAGTTLQGYYTDIHGKQIGNLVLDGYDVGSLYQTGLIRSLAVSFSEPYYYLGISRRADGTDQQLGPLYVPENNFAFEALQAQILGGPSFTTTNEIRTAPEFYFAPSIQMTFLDGYDESILTVPAEDEQVKSCLLPTSLMAQYSIEPGDTVRVAFGYPVTSQEYNARIFYQLDLLVVGSFEKQGTEDTIYAPLGLFFPTDLIWGEGQPAAGAPAEALAESFASTPEQKEQLHRSVFHSASFTLASSRDLPALKDYLDEYGYSQVNNVSKVREFLVIKDAAFNNAVASIQQQIRYIRTLYPVLYVLVGVIALIVSYLLVVSRKKEFATMRGLGSTRAGSFFSFFYEQSLLCLLGTLVGLGAWHLAAGALSAHHLALTAGFFLCYLAGCTVSTLWMNNSSVLAILLDKD